MKVACQTIREAVSGRPVTPGTTPDPGIVLEQLQVLLESNLEFYKCIFRSEVSAKLLESLRLFFSSYMLENDRVYQSVDRDRYALVVSCAFGCVAAMYQDWFSDRLTITLDELTREATAVTRLLLENMM